MSIDSEIASRRRSQLVLVLATAACVLALTTLIGWGVLHYREGATQPPHRPAPSASPQVATADVSWHEVAGVPLPFSRLHGPRITTGGEAAGYSRSEQGAALAAVQVLARTSAAAGPAVFEPVLATQVTGTNLAAMKLTLADQFEQLRASATSAPDGRVAGYVIAAYAASSGSASVDVVLTSPDLASTGRYVAFRVALIWADDDWRVLAPPSGDWASVATTLGASPAGLLDYRELS